MIDKLIEPISTILDKLVQDKDQKARIKYELDTLLQRQNHQIQIEQIKANNEGSKHPSIFVAGWRPMVGWVCGIALCVNYLVIPIANGILVVAGQSAVIATIDMAGLMPVLMGMLGLGTLRTVEKINKVERNR